MADKRKRGQKILANSRRRARRVIIVDMNKAFVREPDQTGPANCPRCGSLGRTVGAQTLDAWLPAGARRMLPDTANFCPFPRCEVVYFDHFERVITVDEVARPVYPKDPSAPLCGCFGFTLDDIESDLAEGGVTRTKALVARAKSPESQCATQSPDGHSCVAEVQRCYLRMKERNSGRS
jgi:hypothetical protein